MIKMFASDLDGTLLNALARGRRNHPSRHSRVDRGRAARCSRDGSLDAADRWAWLYGFGTRRLLLQRIHRS